jgi:hypothetical protein
MALRAVVLLIAAVAVHAAIPVTPDATGACVGSYDTMKYDLRLCSELDGDLIVEHDLERPLPNLRLLGATLLVRGPVRTLAGLEGLMTVGGNVLIESTLLETLGGLSSLAVVRGSIQLPSNTRLTSLHGALPHILREKRNRTVLWREAAHVR